VERLDTRLESQGAEFLVVGELLIRRITAYKTYTNMPGYDVIATNPDRGTAARISVKSRWSSSASQFIIKSFKCDFVVVAKLNRGPEVTAPEYFVLPVGVVRRAPRSRGWNRITFGAIPNFHEYKDRWDQIRKFLRSSRARKGRGLTIRRARTRAKAARAG